MFVVDAKNYDGLVEVHDAGSWPRSDERLFVNGRDRTRLVEGLDRQVAAVRAVLPGDVLVRGVLCFVGENWPLVFRRPLTVRGATVVWPSKLVEHLSGSGPFGPHAVDEIAGRLAVQFPPV